VRLQQDGVPFRPGARELLRELREAASARRWSPCRCAGWRRTSCRSSVRRVRRDRRRRRRRASQALPGPYLQAADALGVDIADTVALEDSRTGLQAAVSARTVAIGVPHIVALDGLDADAIWDSLAARSR
jgi:beta-phosphoglucomutase-like phosphatase (HAD superfamily)